MPIIAFVLTVLIFVIGSFFVSPILLGAALVLFFFAARLIGNSRNIIVVTLLWACFKHLLMPYIPTRPFTFFSLVLFAGIIFFLMFERTVKKEERKVFPKEIKIYIRIIIGLCAVTLVSILLNCLFNFMGWIRFLFEYLFHLPLVVYCIKQVREQDYRKLYKFMLVLFFVQCVLNFTRLVGINPLPNIRPDPKDFSYGTMQSCRFVALYCVGLFSIIFFYVDKVIGTRRMKVKYLWLLLLILAQFAITHTYHMYLNIFIVLLLLSFWLFRVLKNRVRWITGGVIIGFVAFTLMAAVFTSNKETNNAFAEMFTEKSLQARYEHTTTGPKGESYRATFIELPARKPIWAIIGCGPGMYMSSPALIYVSKLALEFMGNYYLTVGNEGIVAAGGIASVPMFGYGAIFGELGWIGGLLYMSIYIYPLMHVGKNVLRKRYTCDLQESMAKGLIIFTTVFLIENFGFDWFNSQFVQVMFCIWVATVWNPAKGVVHEKV